MFLNNFKKENTSHQKGQAVLIVLLSLSVVLIIVLFIMSRSVTDISLSTKEEDSLRAFSAAEAGIERALVIGNSSGTIDSANFSATVSEFAEGVTEYVYPLSLNSGDMATFWFSRPDDAIRFSGSQVKYCWGDVGTAPNTSLTPAVEVTVYYTTTPNDLSTIRVARATLDPHTSRLSTNNFSAATDSNCLIDGTNFEFQTTLNLASLGIDDYDREGVLQYSTTRILYNTTTSHKIGIDVTGTNSTLPSQGEKIVSGGSFGSANRKVEVYQLHPEVPPVFVNAIFSSSGIIK